jgi:hypothetical protein
VRLPSCALGAEAAQRAFELRHTFSDASEILVGEREKLYRRAGDDCDRPLSGQEECDLTERVARAEHVSRRAVVGQNVGVALLDEVDGRSIVVERDDVRTRVDLDLAHGGRNLVELLRKRIGEDRKCREPTRIHGHGSRHMEPQTAVTELLAHRSGSG